MREQAGFHRVTVVFHEGTGRGKGPARAQALCDVLHHSGHRVQLLDPAGLSAEEFRATLRASDAVVVVGGDGLIHSTLPALVDLGIPLGIIPAGTGNDAWRMSGAGSVEESQRRVLQFVAGRGRIRLADLLQLVFDEQPDETTYVLGAVCCGFEALVNARANALPRWLAGIRYIAALVLSLPALRGQQLTLTARQLNYRGKVFVGSISNIRSIGGGIRLFPQARDDDALADVLLIPRAPLLQILPYVGRILRGAPHPYQRTARLSSARVQVAGTSYGDGEPLGNGNFTLSVRPGSLTLMDLGYADTR